MRRAEIFGFILAPHNPVIPLPLRVKFICVDFNFLNCFSFSDVYSCIFMAGTSTSPESTTIESLSFVSAVGSIVNMLVLGVSCEPPLYLLNDYIFFS